MKSLGPIIPLLVAVLLPSLLFLAVISTGYDGKAYLRGDCRYYIATAHSLWEDGDLDISNQLWQPWRAHDRAIAIDRHGRFVPKHPIWLAAAALPLILLFDDPGALVFNFFQLAALCFLMFALARRVARPWPSAIATCLTAGLSYLPHYAWNFSPDVFTSVLFLGALLLLPADRSPNFTRHVCAGVLLAFATTAKPVFALPAVLFPLLTGRPWRRALPALGLGVALPSALWLSLNFQLFGHPLVTPYDRMVHFTPTGIEIHSTREDFTLPIWQGAKDQFLHPTKGILPTSPITVIALLLLPIVFKRHPRWSLFITFSAVGIYFFYSTWALWPASHWGNRYLMPIVALGVLPLAAGLDSLPSFSRRSPLQFRTGQDPPPPNDER